MSEPSVTSLLLTANGVLATVIVFLFRLYTQEVRYSRRTGEEAARALAEAVVHIEASARIQGKLLDAVRASSRLGSDA